MIVDLAAVLANEDGEVFWIPADVGVELTPDDAVDVISAWYRDTDPEIAAEVLAGFDEFGPPSTVLVHLRELDPPEQDFSDRSHEHCVPEHPNAKPYWRVQL